MTIGILNLLVTLVGYLAWPLVALALGLKLVSELDKGLIAKIVKPGGSIEYGGVKLRISEDIQEAQENVVSEGLNIDKDASKSQLAPESDRDPYDLVMESWYKLAAEVTRVSLHYDGWDDQRQVWSNLEILRDKEVISQKTFAAVRALQAARNSIRKRGNADREDALSFAGSASPLTQLFAKIG